jgi:hypothetical protein
MAARKTKTTKTTKSNEVTRLGTAVSGSAEGTYNIIVKLTKSEAKQLSHEVPEGNYKISTLVRQLCVLGATNDDLFSAVKLVFPDSLCATKKSLVTWYRGDGVRTGKIPAEFGPVKLVEPTETKEVKPPTARKKATKRKATPSKAAKK